MKKLLWLLALMVSITWISGCSNGMRFRKYSQIPYKDIGVDGFSLQPIQTIEEKQKVWVDSHIYVQ